MCKMIQICNKYVLIEKIGSFQTVYIASFQKDLT